MLWRNAEFNSREEKHYDECEHKIGNFLCWTLPLLGSISGILALVVNGMNNDKFSFSKEYVDQYSSLSNASKNNTLFESVQLCQKDKGNKDYTCTNIYKQTTNFRSSNYTVECNFFNNIKDVNQPYIYPDTFENLYYDDKNACHYDQNRYYPIKKELIIMLLCFMAISIFIAICCLNDVLYCIFGFRRNILYCCCESTSSSVHNNTHTNVRKSSVRKSAVRKSTVSTDSTASKSTVSTDSTVSKSNNSKSTEITPSAEIVYPRDLIFKV